MGKDKFRMVQLSLDLARVVFGRTGVKGCTVVVYSCPHCHKVPKFDYDWFVGKGIRFGSGWFCIFCGGQWEDVPGGYMLGPRSGSSTS